MNLAAVMEQVGGRLGTIPQLRVFDFPPDNLHPPAAWLGYPEQYTYDETYRRGLDRIGALPVIVAVARVSDRSARDLVAAYVGGSGAKSVKAVLESGTYTAFDELRVTSVEFDILTRGGTDYLAAMFALDIIGSGSA